MPNRDKFHFAIYDLNDKCGIPGASAGSIWLRNNGGRRRAHAG
jgi:hypothetical protein